MEKGVLGIFGYTAASSAYTLKTFANLYRVPFISLSPPISKYHNKMERKFEDSYEEIESSNEPQSEIESSKRDADSKLIEASELTTNTESSNIEEYQLNMYPDMIPLLVSLIKYNRWKTMYYFYNYEEGLNKKIKN